MVETETGIEIYTDVQIKSNGASVTLYKEDEDGHITVLDETWKTDAEVEAIFHGNEDGEEIRLS